MNMSMTNGSYIYCVIRKPESFGPKLYGVDGGEVQCIATEKLAAVVSGAQMKEDYPLTRENLITHQQVIERIMREHSPVLPVSFGTVAESDLTIQEKLLNAKQAELLQALDDIEGKVELTLKALWRDMAGIFQKIVAENPELAQIKQAMAGKVLGTNEAIEVGKTVAQSLEARREAIKNNILAQVEHLIVEHKETPLLGEAMIFNLAFLVPEDNQKKFDAVVRDFDDRFAEEGIYFKYIGPIPPFDFVKIPISFE